MGYGKRVGGDSLGSHNRHFSSQTQVLCSVMMVIFGWVRISAIPSILGSSFLVMLLVLHMGLREFVHKLATECYQYLPLRPPPDPDSVLPPYMVSEGGPPQASEGVLSMNFMFNYLRPKLMVCNPWHLNERECGSGETEVVYLCRLLCYFSDLQYPNWICGSIPYEWNSTFLAQTTFWFISLVPTITLQRSISTLLDFI